MFIILDDKVPEKAKKSLEIHGEVIGFTTSGITYEAISGHPDIFFCLTGREWIVAPNLPLEYQDLLVREKVIFQTGMWPVGSQYPDTARYCAVFSDDMLIHNLDLSDPVILEHAQQQNKIHVNQGYCRCNLISLTPNGYITSDAGIHRILSRQGFHSLYIDPSPILLPGLPHGFIGGTCGVYLSQVFFIGSLRFHPQGDSIRKFIRHLHYDIIELYEGPLFDGGGVMFIE